jgi:hypothetical protein
MNGTPPSRDPSPPHKVVTKDVDGQQFTAGFYPGFARSITVNGVSVYDQKADGPHPFVLPPEDPRPWPSSPVELSSSKGYRVVLHLSDPDHVIDHIELVLRDPASADAAARGVAAFQSGGDHVTIDNTPVLCPPFC